MQMRHSGAGTDDVSHRSGAGTDDESHRSGAGTDDESHRSGAGTDDVYKSKLPHFDHLDGFLRDHIVPRKTTLNLNLMNVVSCRGKKYIHCLKETAEDQLSAHTMFWSVST